MISPDSISDIELALLAVLARANIAPIREFHLYLEKEDAALDRVDTLLAGCIPEGID